MPYDKFGSKIFCRFCKSRNFPSEHHPNQCYTCYRCGTVGHNSEQCESISLSPRRVAKVDNSHLLLPDEPLSIDVEKVQMNGKQIAAWCVICQYPKKSSTRRKLSDNVIYSAKIRRLRQEVTSYATPWSGLTRLDLSEMTVTIGEVQQDLRRILRDRIVVGIGLKDDFHSLGLADLVPLKDQFDFLDHFRDDQGRPINLKTLAYAFLGKRIQEFSPNFDADKQHDPVIDSRMTIKIFQIKDHPNNGPLEGSHQWTRNLVSEAINSGQIRLK